MSASLNEVTIMGRATSDPKTRVVGTGQKIAEVTVAVDRPTKNGGADFIKCSAWNKNAERIEKYIKKGSLFAVVGSITTGSYTNKDGEKVYTWSVKAEKIKFINSKSDSSPKEEEKDDSFVDVPDSFAEEAPFE